MLVAQVKDMYIRISLTFMPAKEVQEKYHKIITTVNWGTYSND